MIDQNEDDEDVMPIAIVAAGIRAARTCGHSLKVTSGCSICERPIVPRVGPQVYRPDIYAPSSKGIARLAGKHAPDEDSE